MMSEPFVMCRRSREPDTVPLSYRVFAIANESLSSCLALNSLRLRIVSGALLGLGNVGGGTNGPLESTPAL